MEKDSITEQEGEKDSITTEQETVVVVVDRASEEDSKAERALVRKLDMAIIPILFVMYLLNHLDRSNIGNAKIAGMETDLKLAGQDYPWVLSIFFFGYVLGEVPSNMVLSRSRPSYYLPGMMMMWGILSGLTALCKSYHQLLAFRFLLGCLESGFFPGVIYFLSCWYRKHEITRRIAVFFSASSLSGAFGGIIAGAITSARTALPGWRFLFVFEGSLTVFCGALACFILPDFPSTPSRRFSPAERSLATQRLQHDGRGRGTTANGGDQGEEETGHWQMLVAATSDWRTWAFAVMHIITSGAGAMGYFIPTLMEDLGYSPTRAQFMTAPIYGTAAITLIAVAFAADRWGPPSGARHPHIAALCTLAASAATVNAVVVIPHVRYAMLVLLAIASGAAVPLNLAWLSSAIEGPSEKRAIAIAITNSLGSLSAVYGSRLWPHSSAPTYRMGFVMVACFYCATGVMALAIGALLGRDRRKREVV